MVRTTAIVVFLFLFLTSNLPAQKYVELDLDPNKFGGDAESEIRKGTGHIDVMNFYMSGLDDMPSSQIRILILPGVIDELGLTKYQRHKISLIRTPEPAWIQREDDELKELGTIFTIKKEDIPKFSKRMRKRYREEIEAANKKIHLILNSRQSRRLRQIEFQYLMFYKFRFEKALSEHGIKLKPSEMSRLRAKLSMLGGSFDEIRMLVLPQLENSLAYRETIGKKVVGQPFVFHEGETFGVAKQISDQIVDELKD